MEFQIRILFLEFAQEVFYFNLILAGGYDGIFVYGEEDDTLARIENYLKEFNLKYEKILNVQQETIKAHFFPINISKTGILIEWN